MTGVNQMKNQIEGSMVDFAYSEIKGLILHKSLKPGQRLAESALSEQLAISRTPVREALRALSNDGWVNLIPSCGVWVASPTRREVLDSYEMRTKLECWALSKALPNVTPLLISRLEECLEEEERIYNGGDHLLYPDINTKFHLLIAESGGNAVLCKHLNILLSQSVIFMALYEDYFDFENNPSLDEHRSIVDILRGDNKDRVIDLMKQHLDTAFSDLKLL